LQAAKQVKKYRVGDGKQAPIALAGEIEGQAKKQYTH
jgi:hypothetical protein